jgi:hypothetical protein
MISVASVFMQREGNLLKGRGSGYAEPPFRFLKLRCDLG